MNELNCFEIFKDNLSSTDINLEDKLDNMCNSEINEWLYNFLLEADDFRNDIEKYIKENIFAYKDFIINETNNLFIAKLIKDKFDYSAGLYNCDDIYIKAIISTLGILYIPPVF